MKMKYIFIMVTVVQQFLSVNTQFRLSTGYVTAGTKLHNWVINLSVPSVLSDVFSHRDVW